MSPYVVLALVVAAFCLGATVMRYTGRFATPEQKPTRVPGAPVPTPSPVRVGERGPEVFTPDPRWSDPGKRKQ